MDADSKSITPEFFPAGYLVAGRYEIDHVLGSGGMGCVYLAKDRILAELVAIKVLHRQLAFEKKYTQRFLREVQLMRRVNHENVVRTFDVGADGDTVYFTMEYAPGKSLLSYMEGRNFPFDVLPAFINQVCEGLQAIHDQGIIHRDLKPENIIFLSDNTIKITDFGVARPEVSELTAHNEIIGSAAYMAPEIWSGDPLSTSVDLYGLGVILYELNVGHLPFEAETPAALMRKHLYELPIPPKERNKTIPQWLNRLILKLLAKNPTERPHSARDVIAMVTAGIDRSERKARSREIVAQPLVLGESSALINRLEENSQRATDPNSTALAARETKGIKPWKILFPSCLAKRSALADLVSLLRMPSLPPGWKIYQLFALPNLRWFLGSLFISVTSLYALTMLLAPESNVVNGSLITSSSVPSSTLEWFSSLIVSVLIAAMPVILLASLSMSMGLIIRALYISAAFQALSGCFIAFYNMSPLLQQTNIDIESFAVSTGVAKQTMIDLAFLNPWTLVYHQTLLAEGIAFHTPVLTAVTDSWFLIAIFAGNITMIMYFVLQLSLGSKRRLSVFFVVLLSLAAILCALITTADGRHISAELVDTSLELFSQTYSLNAAFRKSHFLCWGFIYVVVGLLSWRSNDNGE